MILKIFKKDFLRKKIITVAVFIFIMLSALLMSSGTNMFIDLGNSLDYLIETADAPHFVQYHSGEVDQKAIDEWTSSKELIKKQQTSAMINIEGSKIYFNSSISEANTVMDMAFVKQNESFDFLLDLNNEKIQVISGGIAVPIFYMQKYGLEIGDQIYIKDNNQSLTFTITDFVRDVQMNPSIISSKRFVVSENDFIRMKEGFGEFEYLIEFQLYDLDKIPSFGKEYVLSSLPQKGPSIDLGLLYTLNSIMDGIIAAVIILISLMLTLIALLCMRFMILSTIEEDYREIGVMKAIGILPKDIKKIYLSKYASIGLIGTFIGYIASIFLNQIFSKNIILYSGTAPKGIIEMMLPLSAALIIFLIVVVFCGIVLRRFHKISAIEAIRMGNTGETYRSTKALALYRQQIINPNIFLGLRDVVLRFRIYALLFFVFIICTSIIIVPLNFLNTMKSPDLMKYMGIGRSDILMDLRQSDDILERFHEMLNYVEEDQDIVKYSPLITCQYKIINKDGYEESISIETGDFEVFPLEYIAGVSPVLDNEIALSYLSSKEFDKKVDDYVEVLVGKEYRTMIVSGIYQDITNGGRSAKANIEPNHITAKWYLISVDVNADISKKIQEYEQIFPEAQITDLDGYFNQTFGNNIKQLNLLTILAMVIAGLVAILITSLFLKMLIAKDLSQIAIMRSIGLTLKDIRIQYTTRALVILNSGIIIGTFISNTLGERLLSAILSIIGASNIEFVINPIEAYIVTPMALMIIVTITTLISISSIKEFNISDINPE